MSERKFLFLSFKISVDTAFFSLSCLSRRRDTSRTNQDARRVWFVFFLLIAKKKENEHKKKDLLINDKLSEWDLACTQGHPDLYGSPSACQQLKLGVVHTLPSKQSSELFVRGSEWRRV